MATQPGWATLGSTLAGGNQLPAQLAEAQGEQLGANTTNAIAQANERIAKNKAKSEFADVIQQDPRFHGALGTTMAAAAAAGYNPQEFYGAAKTGQETDLQSRIADVNTPENATARALLALGKNAELQKPVGTAGDVLDLTKQGQPDQYGQLPLGAQLGQAHIEQTRAAAANQTAEAAKNNALAGQGGGKPPTGFAWDVGPDGQPVTDVNGNPQLRKVTGGPQDPNTDKPMSSTERRYFQTSIGAATSAVQELNNVMRAPVGSSTGILGMGKTAGHGLLATPLANMKTALSADDTQQFNAKINNLSRFMAIVENTGRMPPGTMVASIENMALGPADTEGTRLVKLAQGRQNIEAALDGWLNTAPLNDTSKAYVKGLKAQLAVAIPFTVADVDNWQQSKSPTTTIGDAAKMRLGVKPAAVASGVPAGTTPAPAATSAPEAPAVGTVEKGYRFRGGDPAKAENWDEVQP